MQRLCKKSFKWIVIVMLLQLYFGDNQIVHAQTNQMNPSVKNVILMIGDGMGSGQLEIARIFEHGKEGTLFMETLPHVAWSRTYSESHIVTDSAAGGTALATGVKTTNGMVGMSPSKEKLNNITHAFQQAGKKVGIVTTSTVTDATPAAFIGHAENRWDGQSDIAKQLLQKEYDVILGGGATYFSPEKQNGENLIQSFEKKGYTFVTEKDTLKRAEDTDRLLGLFQPTYMSFTLDQQLLASNEPSLSEMTDAALSVLTKGDEGFFLMIEGGRIDHAAHAGDVTSLWKETIAFDETVKQVIEWAEKEGDTLVVVTADHETMGIGVSETIDVERLKEVRASSAYIANRLRGRSSTKDLQTIVREYTGIVLTKDEANELKMHIEDARKSNKKTDDEQVIAWEIGHFIANYHGVGLLDRNIRKNSVTTRGHTANMVPVFAYGPGAQLFEGVLQNTDIPTLMTKIAGVPFK